MNGPIDVSDRIDAKQAILSAFFDQGRHSIADAIAIDGAIHHHVCDMDAQRPVLARHALRNHAKAGLGGREMRESRLAAQACGSAGEDNGAAPEGDEPARRLATNQKAAEAADSPEILELCRRQLAEINAPIVAGVEDDEARRLTSVAWRHRPIEEPNDIILPRRVHHHGFGAAPRLAYRLHDALDLLVRSAGNEEVIVFGRKAPA